MARWALKGSGLGGSTSIEERNECQRGRLGPKGSVKTSPLRTHFKNLERKPEKESRKKTISSSGGLGT